MCSVQNSITCNYISKARKKAHGNRGNFWILYACGKYHTSASPEGFEGLYFISPEASHMLELSDNVGSTPLSLYSEHGVLQTYRNDYAQGCPLLFCFQIHIPIFLLSY